MSIPQRKGDPVVVTEDEGVRGDTTVESLAKLRPAFGKDGTITAGSASQISDGAAAVVVMSQAKAAELGAPVLAEIGAHGVVAGPDPSLQLQPANAIRKALAKDGLTVADLDLVEINEAFAAVGIPSTRDLGVDPEIVNVNGGAIALGHPIGMSGARLALHLALELKRRGGGIGAAGAVRRRRPGRRADPEGVSDRLLAGQSSRRDRRPRPSGRPVASRRGGADVDDLVARARRGEPRAVARLISLVEDAEPGAAARWPQRSPRGPARRQVIGLTGSPGVGKSTTTSALVPAYRAPGARVGVLAVDPSSPFSGGALLGDRVRMQDHATDPGVFIRSMASRGHLGGLAWADPAGAAGAGRAPAAT